MFFLRKNLITIHSQPFGLDMSDLSLKAVWAEKQGTFDRIRSFGSVALPYGVIVDGEIAQPDVVVSTLRSFLDTGVGPQKIRTRDVVCSLPETKAFLRLILMPKMEEDELREAIQWELEGNIPLPLDQIYYDFQILDDEMGFSTDKGKVSVLVVAVARHVVDQFVEVLERAGLRPIGLETESVTQARILVPSDERPYKTSLIIDIGDRRTSFLIAVGNVPIFTSSSTLSSQMLTDLIAKTSQVTLEEAERMKIQYGIGTSGPAASLTEAVRPVLEGLAVEVERSMEFYLNSLRYTPNIDRILLTGGGANLQGLVPYLARRLQRPVEVGNPWVNFSLAKSLPPIPYGDAIRYSTALGLAVGESSAFLNP